MGHICNISLKFFSPEFLCKRKLKEDDLVFSFIDGSDQMEAKEVLNVTKKSKDDTIVLDDSMEVPLIKRPLGKSIQNKVFYDLKCFFEIFKYEIF